MEKADITFKQIDEHYSGWCDSGHKAPETFKLDGPDGEEKPTRFFIVTGKGINGIYCEPCLCVANYIAKQKKK